MATVDKKTLRREVRERLALLDAGDKCMRSVAICDEVTTALYPLSDCQEDSLHEVLHIEECHPLRPMAE